MLTKPQGRMLLKLAKDAIREALKRKTVNAPLKLRGSRQQPGVFVTLLKDGELRGSMGYAEGTYPLPDAVVKAARDAAFKDPRFKPVKKTELQRMKIRIDILSRPIPARISQIRPGRHGVYVEFGLFKGLQLPEDGRKYKWTPRELVQNALRKAGLAPEMWNDKNVRIYKFTTKSFGEG